MKFPSMIVLLVCAPLAWADDETKSSPKTSGRPAVSTTTSNSEAPRAPQPVTRRPVNTPGHPNVRPVNPNANATSALHNRPTVSRSRPIIPNNTPGTGITSHRTTVVPPSARPGTVAATRANRARVPSRTGNELSFSQARAQCSRQHHDRDWWRHHHTLVVFYGGGYWFWNAGWWFPAWGYSPYYNNYIYDGPIYGSGEMSPGDVTAQVQEALAQKGYYYGPIDGVLGPETRDAILRFQADNGLATTAAIDEPTLDTLGLT